MVHQLTISSTSSNVRTENSLNSISESTCGTIEEVSFEWSYHRISSTDIESFESSAEEVSFEWSYHRISSTDIESFESSAEEVLFEW